MGKTPNGSSRESWGSKWGFILACIGSTVGMGNIWLFPSRVTNYGGAFLTTYPIFGILIGLPGVISEVSFGRETKEGSMGTFRQACASQRKGNAGALIGGIPIAGALMLTIGHSVVVDWTSKYVFNAFTGKALSYGMDVSDVSGYEQVLDTTASFFGNNFRLIATLAVTFIIMVPSVTSGIEKANKTMIPLFFLLFIDLAIHVYSQPEASDDYRYIFSINPEKLKDPVMWVYALGQPFFSLPLAGNGMVIYGSYLSDNGDIVSSTWKAALFNTLAASLATLVVVPAMAAAGSATFDGSPDLMFTYLPSLFVAMPSRHVVVMVSFVAVLFAGLISLMNLFEAPIATLQDNPHFSRARAVTVIGIIRVVVALCIQDIVSGWMDFVSIYTCPLGTGLAGTIFVWIWGKQAVEDAVSPERKQRIGGWYYPLYKYGLCILTMAVFTLGIVNGGIG